MYVNLLNKILVSNILNCIEGKFKDFIYRIVINLILILDIEKLLSILIEEERMTKREES